MEIINGCSCMDCIYSTPTWEFNDDGLMLVECDYFRDIRVEKFNCIIGKNFFECQPKKQ